MIQFLKDNTWIISCIALVISLVSASITIIDRLRSWNEISKNKRLKRDKAILQPIIDLKTENYYKQETTVMGNKTTHSTSQFFSKLHFLIQSVDTKNISSKELILLIENLKSIDADHLFKHRMIPTGTNSSMQFSDVLISAIQACKEHVATVI